MTASLHKPSRIEAIDALRALALLAVVVVNFSGYGEVPLGGVLPAPVEDDGPLTWFVSIAVLALLQGKGIALLTFLFGYSLSLGGFAPRRLDRMLGLGLLHGFVLYLGDILSQYALAGRWLRRWRGWRLRRVWRRAVFWLAIGVIVQILAIASIDSLPSLQADHAPTVDHEAEPGGADAATWVEAQSAFDWWRENASGYFTYLLAMFTVGWPWTLGLVAAGYFAGRLRLLTHRRWQPLWARAARWALPVLLVQWGWAAWTAESQLLLREAWSLTVQSLLGLVAVAAWIPWLLLHVRRWPAFLALAGRQTLSPYLLCSLVTVAVWCNWALGWRPSVLQAYAGGALLWWALMLLSARATRAGRRLPAEAWLARR